MSKKESTVRTSECSGCLGGLRSDGPLHLVFTPNEKRMLSGLVFRDSELNRVDFSHADLRETEFRDVSLSGADFSYADLRGACFIGCDLRNARFDHAVMSRTRFDKSYFVGARGLSDEMSDYVMQHGGLLWLS